MFRTGCGKAVGCSTNTHTAMLRDPFKDREWDGVEDELTGPYQWKHFWAWVGFWAIWLTFIVVILIFA